MEQKKVFVTRGDFPEKAINLLRKKYNVNCYPYPHDAPENYIVEHVVGASAIYCLSTTPINIHILEAAGKKLKVVSTMSIGYEHIDTEECKRRGIRVCNGANAVSVSCVAEFTIGLLLAVSRKIAKAATAIQRGEWTEWTPSWYLGRGLTHATVGIVGMGRIGQAVLERILPFEVAKVYYYDISAIPEAEKKGAVSVSFDVLLQKSDHVIVTCTLTEQTRNLFNSRAFALMKPSATFINASRGGVVNQDALMDALKRKQIKAAGIDVMYPEPLPKDHELLSVPNIVVTPHIAAAEEVAMERLSQLTSENIIAVLEGRPPQSQVC